MNPDARALQTAARLRAAALVPSDAPLDVEAVLMELYPVACVELPALTVATVRDYLRRHRAMLPSELITCRDRRLRGGIVAWRGRGLLFADQEDPPEERRFTFAHEAAHYLRDHLYPRQDLLDRFGEPIRAVLDGWRPPTLAERLDALLARASLNLYSHLLGREGPLEPDVLAREAEADAFACDVLAPAAALRARFPQPVFDEETVVAIQQTLCAEFGLPPRPAMEYARAFLTHAGQTPGLLQRLRLI